MRNISVEFLNEPPLSTKKDYHYIRKLSSTIKKELKVIPVIRNGQGSSDARHFTSVGCKAIEFGPSGGCIGSDNEWVSINGLDKYYSILTKYLEELDRN